MGLLIYDFRKCREHVVFIIIVTILECTALLPDYCYSADLSPKGKDRTKHNVWNNKSAIKCRNYLICQCFRERVFVRFPIGVQFPDVHVSG